MSNRFFLRIKEGLEEALKDMKNTHYCKQCGARFTTDFPTKLYCGEACKYKAQLAKATEGPKKLPMAECDECHQSFQMRAKTSRFCTNLCKTAWKNKNYVTKWKDRG